MIIFETSIRLKELRKTLKLTQKEFAASMGLKQTSYSEIENKRQELTERNKNLICQTFNVNRDWLETGQGEMFIENDDDALDRLIKEHNLNEGDKSIITAYISLSQSERETVLKFIDNIKNNRENIEFNNNTVTPKPVFSHSHSCKQQAMPNLDELTIDERVEWFRQELEKTRAKKASNLQNNA